MNSIKTTTAKSWYDPDRDFYKVQKYNGGIIALFHMNDQPTDIMTQIDENSDLSFLSDQECTKAKQLLQQAEEDLNLPF